MNEELRTAGLTSEKKGAGCSCGCLTLVIIGVVFLVLLGLASYWAYGRIEPYLSDTPSVQQVNVPADVARETESKLDAFFSAAAAGDAASLSLNGDEINGLITRKEELEELRDHLFVRLEQDAAKVNFSLPLMHKKFLNGVLTLKGAGEGLGPHVRIVGLEVKGAEIPSRYLEEGAEVDLAAPFKDERRKAVERIDTVKIENGLLILKTQAER